MGVSPAAASLDAPTSPPSRRGDPAPRVGHPLKGGPGANGHSTIPLDLDVYSHVAPSVHDEAAAPVNRLLAGS